MATKKYAIRKDGTYKEISVGPSKYQREQGNFEISKANCIGKTGRTASVLSFTEKELRILRRLISKALLKDCICEWDKTTYLCMGESGYPQGEKCFKCLRKGVTYKKP